jgi:hypothetical protein
MAMPKYRLKRQFQGKIIATSAGVRIDNDFLHNPNHESIIEGDAFIASHFETRDGGAVNLSLQASQKTAPVLEGEEISSLDLTAKIAISLIKEMDTDQAIEFVQGDTRVTVLEAAGISVD